MTNEPRPGEGIGRRKKLVLSQILEMGDATTAEKWVTRKLSLQAEKELRQSKKKKKRGDGDDQKTLL